VRSALGSLVLNLLLVAAPVAAQAPLAGRAPNPKASPKPEPSEDLRLRAEKQEMVEKGHFRATGFVDLQSGETRLQSDLLDYYETDRPDGTKSRRVVAVGNVVFIRGEERIAGERLEMDLDTGKGVFSDARGYVQPGLLVEARTIERVDDRTYRVRDAKFTSCYQPNPRWGFDASSARIHVDDKVVAHNMVLRVKDVPTLYAPLFVYPIRQDQRSTGFLIPHVGNSSLRGWNFGDAFFWAMGRSFDQTFYFDRYTKFGYGFGHEFRYALDAPSAANFKTYLFRVLEVPVASGGPTPTTLKANAWDYDLDWTAQQSLPGRVRATLRARRFSNLSFQETIQDDLALASNRTRNQSLNLQRAFRQGTVSVLADSVETFFGADNRFELTRHRPSVRLSGFPLKIPKTPLLFNFEGSAEQIERGDENVNFQYSRLDAFPRLSASAANSFIGVTPHASVRYTRYGASLKDPNAEVPDVTGPPLERKYFEGVVELDGPNFERILENRGKWYTDKFKHTIGPEVVYTYRSPVDNVDLIPPADYGDFQLGTSQVQYALVQHFWARRPGRSGKPTPQEFLTVRVQRSYYFQIDKKQNLVDPAYVTSRFNFRSDAGIASHNSPLLVRADFKPTPRVGTRLSLEYDLATKETTALTVTENLTTDRFGLSATWSKGRPSSSTLQPNEQPTLQEFIRGQANIALWPGHLNVDGSVDYDRVNKILRRSSARLRYSVQCCGFSVETIQFQFNNRIDNQFRVTIELANIGSFGNFMGDDPTGGRRGGGY
jgi:LPS-assembly protein